ncbi:unnamed protein product [Echinostoma caproni]|uniref:Uncharacterized protein n=1 Tax=Echinostoma caproni TaxID=27848 RepID=A0A183B9L6_9TREM|nr:unnamed protein product [Echinostoma caproni]
MRGKSVKVRAQPVLATVQLNSSIRQRKLRDNAPPTPVEPQPTEPTAPIKPMTPTHERPKTPYPNQSMPLTKSISSIAPESPTRVASSMPPSRITSSTIGPVLITGSKPINSDTSDVDQLAETHHVIRIPTRPYRTSSRRRRIGTVTRGCENGLRKNIEPGNFEFRFD